MSFSRPDSITSLSRLSGSTFSFVFHSTKDHFLEPARGLAACKSSMSLATSVAFSARFLSAVNCSTFTLHPSQEKSNTRRRRRLSKTFRKAVSWHSVSCAGGGGDRPIPGYLGSEAVSHVLFTPPHKTATDTGGVRTSHNSRA